MDFTEQSFLTEVKLSLVTHTKRAFAALANEIVFKTTDWLI